MANPTFEGAQVKRLKTEVATLENRLSAVKRLIQKERETIEGDERYSYPTATVFENAPLALIQLEMETKIALLNKLDTILEKLT